jgi:hypothetical protein
VSDLKPSFPDQTLFIFLQKSTVGKVGGILVAARSKGIRILEARGGKTGLAGSQATAVKPFSLRSPHRTHVSDKQHFGSRQG